MFKKKPHKNAQEMMVLISLIGVAPIIPTIHSYLPKLLNVCKKKFRRRSHSVYIRDSSSIDTLNNTYNTTAILGNTNNDRLKTRRVKTTPVEFKIPNKQCDIWYNSSVEIQANRVKVSSHLADSWDEDFLNINSLIIPSKVLEMQSTMNCNIENIKRLAFHVKDLKLLLEIISDLSNGLKSLHSTIIVGLEEHFCLDIKRVNILIRFADYSENTDINPVSNDELQYLNSFLPSTNNNNSHLTNELSKQDTDIDTEMDWDWDRDQVLEESFTPISEIIPSTLTLDPLSLSYLIDETIDLKTRLNQYLTELRAISITKLII